MTKQTKALIDALLAEMEAMGANVTTGRAASAAKIARAEKALGFPLPPSYREFLQVFGSISIELVRTWFFYGVPEKKKLKKEYVAEFAPSIQVMEEEGYDDDDDEHAYYFPRRFLILADGGLYGNVASGFVWDADLEHIRGTAGGRMVERSNHRGDDYWAFLVGQLDEIHATISDPEHPICASKKDEVDARRKLS
jgi:hypothetical protein